MSDVFEEVQAALLNSDGDPATEIQAALRALVQFASAECEMTSEALQHMFDEALAEEFE